MSRARLLDLRGCRRLAAAALLRAVAEAHAGDESALAWITESELAALFAEVLGLGELWPPAPGQLVSLRALGERARERPG